MSLILFGGYIYTTKQVVYIYQSHRRKEKTCWQKNVQRGCVCDEMQLVVVLLPNTLARKLRILPLQSYECMSR